MRPATNQWPNSDGAKGVLFFAQMFRELLSEDTFESFRAMTLDTVSRISEARSLTDEVLRGTITARILDPIVDELKWSLENDSVAKDIAPDEILSFQECVKSKYETQTLAHILIYMHKKLKSKYSKYLEKEIVETCSDSRARIKLRKLAGFYCSNLVNEGHSKDYILEKVEERFFLNPINRAGPRTLASFFAKFEPRSWRYDVVVQVDANFGRYLSQLGFAVRLVGNSAGHAGQAYIAAGAALSDWLVTHRVEARDEFAAAQLTEQRLASIRALALMAPKGLECHWESSMYVTRFKSQSGRFITNRIVGIKYNVTQVLSGRLLLNLKTHSRRILEGFDEPSTERLLNSIGTSALARNSPNLENMLVSIWSSFEVMLSTPPPDTVRITHYERAIVPAICYQYARSQFVAVHDALLVSYRRRFQKLLDQVTPGVMLAGPSRFVYMLLLKNNEQLRHQLTQLLSKNPLALHRTWKLIKDFGSATDFTKSISHHENRVKWQIHRIYRARNHLVHAGHVPPYLEGLVLNSYEYYRSAISSVVSHSRKESHRSNIDQVVAEIGFEYAIYKKIVAAGPLNDERRFYERLLIRP